MNKIFEIIEAKKIFDFDYKKLSILVHPKSYVHAIVKFSNGLTKILVHDTNMVIPIFNSIYQDSKKNITSKKLDLNIMNNLNFQKLDKKKFPVVGILNNLPQKDTLFETVIVSANDILVEKFLNGEISFLDISKLMQKIINNKEFLKFKKIPPRNIDQITHLSHYVSLKINALRV
jgi:1-deoxy-D-xylulose-5-phosphate reductoisomerase